MTTIRTPENRERLLTLLAEHGSLRKIAPVIGCSEMALRAWVRDDDELHSHYARGRDLYIDHMADEVLEISDTAKGNEEVASARLRIDTRKWYLCKLAPKRYGDKVDVNHGGQEGNPLNVTIKRYSFEDDAA